MKFVHWLVMGCVVALPLSASAQWQWLDKNGKKVFSDQAPPPDVPEKNILRRVGPPPAARSTANPNVDAPPAEGTPAEAAAPAKTAGAAPKPTGVDKELEEKTKKAEAEQKAKQAAEEAKIAKAKADNCALARQSKATVDSGIRIAKVNAKGEREIMDDAARAAEQKRIQGVIDSDCK
ncbi:MULTISPECIES: DUF4124 domain-containing protein [unclassified Variovorax]|jgi:hypothetical protein|uniref:DUF4124 domain-containing protein n=1 Tax=unclassified Variovorax TaxID=663243 RepID=UPI000F7F3733|nr:MULTISPECIES: DUF4124 domain-containing protein [unclassified Variovorax]RSZ37167.1 DUF4124 domain-containing protein [Variovorax sp. 553]RSZ37981.1 DUF4124 domain-containing protein [Variovorax sp. 679]